MHQGRREAGSGARETDPAFAGATGPCRCSPSQLHRVHQLVRNHGMSVFHPRDCTRSVTSSQMGQRSPSGRMKKNTIVATTIRSTKKPTRTTTNTTGRPIRGQMLSDFPVRVARTVPIRESRADARSYSSAPPRRSRLLSARWRSRCRSRWGSRQDYVRWRGARPPRADS